VITLMDHLKYKSFLCTLFKQRKKTPAYHVEFVLKTRNYAHGQDIVEKLGEVGFKPKMYAHDV